MNRGALHGYERKMRSASEESRRLNDGDVLENLSALTDDKKEAIWARRYRCSGIFSGNELGFGLRQETPKIIFVAAAGEDARRHFLRGPYWLLPPSADLLTALLWNRYDLVPDPPRAEKKAI